MSTATATVQVAERAEASATVTVAPVAVTVVSTGTAGPRGPAGGGGGAHPDLASHDALGLATQAELDTESAARAAADSALDARVDALELVDPLTQPEADLLYQPVDSDLTAIAALSTTVFGRSLLALADAAAGRTALALGTAATAATGDFDAAGSAAAAQAASQPLDSDLTAIAALATTAFGRSVLTQADASALRTLAGLGSLATLSAVGSAQITDGSIALGDLAFTPVVEDASGDVTLDSGVFSAGTLSGGNLRHVTHAVADNSYTQTADPADELLGSFFNAKWNVTLDYVGAGGTGPVAQSGYFGPRGAFNLEGVATYKNSTGQFGLSPLAFLSVMAQINESGTSLTLTPAWTYVASNFYLADAATVSVTDNDTLDGPAAFIDTTTFGSGDTGHYDGAGNSLYSFVSLPFLSGHVTFDNRVGFEVRDAGDSSGFALSMSNGHALTLDAANKSLTNNIGLRVAMLTAGTTNKAIEIAPGTNTLTADPGGAFIDCLPGTTTLNFASATMPTVLRVAGTIELEQTGFLFGMATLFNFAATIKNKSTVAANFSLSFGYVSQPTFQADGATITGSTHYGFYSKATTSVLNAGTLNAMTFAQFNAAGITVGAGTTVSLRTALNVSDSTVAGTLTTQVGLDIAALAGGTTNIGIRNASSTVNTPTAKTITATTDTVPASASVIRLNNSSGSSKTLASTPTIADGQDGQILRIFNGSASDVVLQDQGTLASSNLRLGAATRTLATRDSITLMFSSTVGDWIELAFSNVV